MNDLPLTSARVIQLGEDLLRTLQEMETAESSPLSPSQIQRMRGMIQERIAAVRNSQLPPRSMRHRYLTRETIDTWPLGIPLAMQVCGFEEQYNNL
jgi:hypothetical protein